jgi:hypothetical protein
MKVKIINSLLWNWNRDTRSPEIGDAIKAVQKLGSDKYKYPDAGKVRYSLLRTETALMTAYQEIEKLRAKMLQEAVEAQSKTGGKAGVLEGEQLLKYATSVNDLMEFEDEHDIRQVKWSQLDIGTNNIPTDVLRPLMDSVILDDAPKDE